MYIKYKAVITTITINRLSFKFLQTFVNIYKVFKKGFDKIQKNDYIYKDKQYLLWNLWSNSTLEQEKRHSG